MKRVLRDLRALERFHAATLRKKPSDHVLQEVAPGVFAQVAGPRRTCTTVRELRDVARNIREDFGALGRAMGVRWKP